MKKLALSLLLIGVMTTAFAVDNGLTKQDCSRLFTTAGGIKVTWEAKQADQKGALVSCFTQKTCEVNGKPGPGCAHVGGGPNDYYVGFYIYGQGWKLHKSGLQTVDDAISFANNNLPAFFEQGQDKK